MQMDKKASSSQKTHGSAPGGVVSGFILLYLLVVVVLPVVLLLFTKTGNLYLLGNEAHDIYFLSICNLLFGEIAVGAFGIWGTIRPQQVQQEKRSWILTLLLGVLWLALGVFGLMS